MHDHTHWCHTGEQRISTVPACIKSIPHLSLLDDHSSCITGKYGEAMEAVHQTDDQNTSTINLSPTEAFSSDSAIISTWSRTQHLNIIHTSYQPLIQAATQLLKKEPSFDGIPVSSKHMGRSLLPFLGDAFSWLKRDSHNQGCQCHQNKDQPIDHHSTEPIGDPSSHHICT